MNRLVSRFFNKLEVRYRQAVLQDILTSASTEELQDIYENIQRRLQLPTRSRRPASELRAHRD